MGQAFHKLHHQVREMDTGLSMTRVIAVPTAKAPGADRPIRA